MNAVFLLGLKISGIKNIEKPIEIPFYKKTIKDDFDPDQYRVKGIYGENGSGKTGIMVAVKIMTRILLDRNYLNDSVNQRLLAENINKKTNRFSIEAVFRTMEMNHPFIYRYRAVLEIRPDQRVYLSEESLERKNGRYTQNAYAPVFSTRNGILIRFGEGELFDFCREKTQNLLEQRSFASFALDIEAAGYQEDPEWNHLFSLAVFASSIIVEIDEEDNHRKYAYDYLKRGNEQVALHEARDLTIFSRASTVESDKKEVMIPRDKLPVYQERTEGLYRFIRIFKTDLKGIRIEAKEYGEFCICRRIMVYDGYELDEEYESRGIRKLMRLFDVLDAACNGEIVFIDELDSNVNDVYLNKLIEYFVYYGKGQLCFTAHNLSPMSVLRESKCAISFISGVNTLHTWTSNGNQNPEHAYRDGFIEDSPFNVEASDFLGVLGGADD